MDGKNRVAAILAIGVLLNFIAVFIFLAFGKVDPANKDYFNMALVALIGFVNIGFGYYLGSSLGSAQKNTIIAQGVADPPNAGQSSVKEFAGSEGGFITFRLLAVLVVFIIPTLAFSLIGCATTQPETPQSIATKSLLTMKEAIVTTAKTGSALCKNGKLDAATCSEIESFYILAGPAYDLAADSLVTAIRLNTDEGWKDYNNSVLALTLLYNDILRVGTTAGLIKADGPQGSKGGAQ